MALLRDPYNRTHLGKRLATTLLHDSRKLAGQHPRCRSTSAPAQSTNPNATCRFIESACSDKAPSYSGDLQSPKPLKPQNPKIVQNSSPGNSAKLERQLQKLPRRGRVRSLRPTFHVCGIGRNRRATRHTSWASNFAGCLYAGI